jgi:DNA primase
LRRAVADAVPFLQFRLERVLDSANVATAEGRARAAESAMGVLAEHPSEIVRDQYLMQVADRLRLDFAPLRPRVAELARNPVQRPSLDSQAPAVAVRQRSTGAPMPRPGLEALRLCVHFPIDVKDRLIAPYFVNEIQRDIFEGLSSEQSLSEVIEDLQRRGEEEASAVLSQLAVDELEREYTAADVTAVVSQLVRSAVRAELRNVERDLREGRMAPDVAMATIRDVKERLEYLETAQGETAEYDLREWLLERSSSAHS